jgi:hypothetical protein
MPCAPGDLVDAGLEMPNLEDLPVNIWTARIGWGGESRPRVAQCALTRSSGQAPKDVDVIAAADGVHTGSRSATSHGCAGR